MQKIATCCYCGTRAALVLCGDVRHELSCATCGAPLHEMKAIPRARTQAAVRGGRMARTRPKPQSTSRPKSATKRHRRRKPFFREVLEEIWDVIEDVFD